jgi:hypothetical protein
MAVRIDKKISQNENISSNYSKLQAYLLRRAGRKLNDIEYIGLLRNNALSDLEDPGKALVNTLEYITRIDDAGEISIYGTYKAEDFEITRTFVDNEITNSFLTPLKDISIAGGVAGATISTNPRIRLEDRIDLIDSFTGKGSLNNIHTGPTALFYSVNSGKLQDIGNFTFANGYTSGGAVSSPALGFSAITTDGLKTAYVLSSYTNPNTSEEVSLIGTGIFVVSTGNGSTASWEIGDSASKDRLDNLKNIFGAIAFNTIVFRAKKEYSVLNQPEWFTMSPGEGEALITTDGGPDDIDPTTSDSELVFERGAFNLYIEKEYFNSGAYVESRVPPEDRDSYSGDNITKDSNMRFAQPPRVLRDNVYNWGVRWDGYLRLDRTSNGGEYLFEVQTNTAIKIDVCNGPTSGANNGWTNVFDSSYDKVDSAINISTNVDTKASRVLPSEDMMVSKVAFGLENIDDKFAYDTSLDGSSRYRYVPISIRMWVGGPDKADPENLIVEVPLEPNLYIKPVIADIAPDTPLKSFSGEDSIAITGTAFPLSVAELNGSTFLSKILTDISTNSATYTFNTAFRLYEKQVTETKEYVDEEGVTQTESVTNLIAINNLVPTFNISGGVITITALTDTADPANPITDLSSIAGTYSLRVFPSYADFNKSPLWSTKIIGPKQDNYKGYRDLINESITGYVTEYIEPSVYKLTLDQRPEYWKVSDGNKFTYGEAITKENDPLDGFISNYFKATLRSEESPTSSYVGLYGDGTGTFSTRENLILGEAKYGSDTQGSNYAGMRLTSNFLGEGGKLKFTGIPINNATFDWSGLTGANAALGQNDLGGGTNHQTIAAANITQGSTTVHYDGAPAGNENTSKFYLHDELGATTAPVIAADDPTTLGLPAFGDETNAVWGAPITINAVSTTSGGKFVAPLVMGVERVIYDRDATVGNRIITDIAHVRTGNQVYLLAFTSSFEPSTTGSDTLDGETIQFYTEDDIAFQFANVDTGESIAFADALKITYDGSTFVSSTSEVPKVPSERVTPFGYDSPVYSTDICYPPYVISDPNLEEAAVDDATLYNSSTPKGNFDVFWGDHTASDLTGEQVTDVFMALNITEKLEFSYSSTEDPSTIIETSNVSLSDSDYTHRLKVELPIFDPNDPTTPFDEDIYFHIGNNEKVKDVYYLFINGKEDPSSSSSGLLSGLPQ